MSCKWQYVRGAIAWCATSWMKIGRDFQFDSHQYEYMDRAYNFTRFNERRVEIPIMQYELAKHDDGKVLEVGNVLSHYMPIRHHVIDKYEKSSLACFENADAATYQSSRKYDLIVSISTMEHVGWDDTPRDPGRLTLAFGNLRSFLERDAELICSFPMGYNRWLDDLVLNQKMPFKKIRYLQRVSWRNEWVEIESPSESLMRFGHPYPFANILCLTWLGST